MIWLIDETFRKKLFKNIWLHSKNYDRPRGWLNYPHFKGHYISNKDINDKDKDISLISVSNTEIDICQNLLLTDTHVSRLCKAFTNK